MSKASRSCTVKGVALVAVPRELVTVMKPVVARVGTIALSKVALPLGKRARLRSSACSAALMFMAHCCRSVVSVSSEHKCSREIAMTTLEIKLLLPEPLAREAKKAGLLNAPAIESLLREAMRKRALDRFLQTAERVAAAGVPPMNEEEIQAEVNAVRKGRRKRIASGR
jgi:hypothetical protein